MPDWFITQDPDSGVLRLRFPPYISTEIARDAIKDLVKAINAREQPSVVVLDLRSVRHFDAEAPVIAARIGAPVVNRVEHAYVLTGERTVRAAATAAAVSIGLPFTCHDEEPDSIAIRTPEEQS